MELSKRKVDSATVLELDGRFDAHEVPAVRTAIEEALAADSARIVVDMRGVKFIDSAGLAALVQGLKRCRQRNGDLRICQLARPVQVVFELTRLDRTFGIFETEEDALRSFSGMDVGS